MLSSELTNMTVGILGGTGAQGRGLAFRFAQAGMTVLIGSRNADRAAKSAAEINALGISGNVRGLENSAAAEQSDLIIAAVPWDGHEQILESLRNQLSGKIVVDCVNPIGFDKGGAFAIAVAEGSAAQQAEQLLPDSRVVAAFHHISAVFLSDPNVSTVDCDVLVLGDDRAAVDQVIALAEVIPGVRGVAAGKLRNAGPIEALTPNLIAINRRYRAHAGIRITDIN